MAKNAPFYYKIGSNLLIMLGLGTRIPVWTTGERPSSPKRGQIGFNSTLTQLEVYTGSAWFKAEMDAI